MILLFALVAMLIVNSIFVWHKIYNLDKNDLIVYRAIKRLASHLGFSTDLIADTLYFFRTSTDETSRDLQRMQEQFALFLKDSGYKYVPQKTEESHQGDEHTVKVTPARFVKAKSRK